MPCRNKHKKSDIFAWIVDAGPFIRKRITEWLVVLCRLSWRCMLFAKLCGLMFFVANGFFALRLIFFHAH